MSTVTVRNAVEELEDEGLIAKRQGAHTLVHDREPTHRLVVDLLEPERLGERPVSFAASQPPRGELRQVGVAGRVPASTQVASLLGVVEGEEIEQRRLTLVNGDEPVLTSTSYLPGALADGSPVPDVDVGQLALGGHPVTSVGLVLRARMPDPQEFDDLSMVKGTPVQVLTHHVLVGNGGRPGGDPAVLAAVQVVSRADRVFIQIKLDGG